MMILKENLLLLLLPLEDQLGQEKQREKIKGWEYAIGGVDVYIDSILNHTSASSSSFSQSSISTSFSSLVWFLISP